LIPYFKDAFARIVYLDIDLLLMGDINDLFKIDLQGFPMGAVEDSQHVQLAERLQIENYFNAGVFVIDLKHFEIENLGSHAQSCLDNRITLKYQDQDVLNKVFSGYWLKMPNEYNLQIGFRYPNKNTTFVSPKVIHFVGPFKPWDVGIGKYHEEWKVRYDSFQKIFPNEVPNVIQRSANFGTKILIYFANTSLTDILPIQLRIRLASILIKKIWWK
jgi:lipopolysaccharide biosynthesis glycosyltransferase